MRDIYVVAKNLASNTVLLDLAFCGTYINDYGANALCNALQLNTTLQRFVLSNNVFGLSGILSIGAMLQKNKTITHLTIEADRVNEYGELKTLCNRDVAMQFYELVHMENYALLDVALYSRSRVELGIAVEEPHPCREVSLLFIAMCKRNFELEWRKVQPLIVDICIGLAPLNLPIYVLLWIIDWLPHLERAHKEVKKVRLIESVVGSIRKVETSRRSTAKSFIRMMFEQIYFPE